MPATVTLKIGDLLKFIPDTGIHGFHRTALHGAPECFPTSARWRKAAVLMEEWQQAGVWEFLEREMAWPGK